VSAVCGIDVDQDRADFGRGVLHDGPFGAVRRPHSHALTGFDPEGHQTPCNEVDFGVQLCVCPAPVDRDVDQRLYIGMRCDRAFEVLPDRLLEDRRVGRPGVIRLHRLITSSYLCSVAIGVPA
jgi:hypothetical protein